MTVIELHGRINESGELEVLLPEGLPAGDVRVRIELAEIDWAIRQLTRIGLSHGADAMDCMIASASS